MEKTLFNLGTITSEDIKDVAEGGETPVYLYDENLIVQKCGEVKGMANAFGLEPRFAMKANSTRAILELITSQGFGIDASSLNEVRRAEICGIPYDKIMLTSQEVPSGEDKSTLEDAMTKGLRYNICSQRQFMEIAEFASRMNIPVSIRIHPGTGGSGESVTRNTASPYSCFGIHVSQLDEVLKYAQERGVVIDQVHNHIGSGGSPEKWRDSVDTLLGIAEQKLEYLPNLKGISFGGGLKEARMPDETPADLKFLGHYAAEKIKEFAERTGKELVMEIEPGTYITAMAGNLVTRVIDKKTTGPEGFEFLVLDGGMEVNARPLFYGSRHPFAIVSQRGELLSSDWYPESLSGTHKFVPVGRCCESGDSQSLDSEGNIVPRLMAEPAVGDYFVIGGGGAYCSTMAPFNYNSHFRAPEVLKRINGTLELIRRKQTLNQIVENEFPLTTK
jgi:diaminopimelate decarboxylase